MTSKRSAKMHVIGPGATESVILEVGNYVGVVDCFATEERSVSAPVETPVVRFLAERDTRRLMFVALTNVELGYIVGTIQLLEAFSSRIDELWLPEDAKDLAERGHPGLSQLVEFVSTQSRVRMRTLMAGQTMQFGPASVDTIASSPISATAQSRTDQLSTVLSPALLLRLDGCRILLGGHADRGAWADVARQSEDNLVECQVIKVPGHGSATCIAPGLFPFHSYSGTPPIAVLSPRLTAESLSPDRDSLATIASAASTVFTTNLSDTRRAARLDHNRSGDNRHALPTAWLNRIAREPVLTDVLSDRVVEHWKGQVSEGGVPSEWIADLARDSRLAELICPSLVRDSLAYDHHRFRVSLEIDGQGRLIDKYVGERAGVISVDELRAVTRDGDAFDVASADTSEKKARILLEEGRVTEARNMLNAARKADGRREARLRSEFGFVFAATDHSMADETVWWQIHLWRLVSRFNEPFVAPHYELRTADEGAHDDESPAEDAHSESPLDMGRTAASDVARPEEKGEQLEEAIVTLFGSLFDLEAGDHNITVQKLRQQTRGLQFGHDVNISLRFTGPTIAADVKCHLECKNLSRPVTLEDVSAKLAQEKLYDRGISHWILVSPVADPANELDYALEEWESKGEYGFQVQVWSPTTFVEEFFALSPEVHKLFYPTSQLDPVALTDAQRNAIRQRWTDRLAPAGRVPRIWQRYLRDPANCCTSMELLDTAELDDLYCRHLEPLATDEAGNVLEEPLAHYVDAWLDDPHNPCMLVLGEYGDGKTVFSYLTARVQSERFLQAPETGWFPLRMSLRELGAAGSDRGFLRRRLEEFGATFEDWVALRRQQAQILVVLDGFDEMSKSLDPETISHNIERLLELRDLFNGTKILLTSRTHFFASRNNKERLLDRLGAPQILHLARFPRSQTLAHLEQFAVNPEQRKRLTEIRMLHDPIGLAAKPLYLQMIKDSLDSLSNRDDLDEVALYETYARSSLERKSSQLDTDKLEGTLSQIVDNLERILERIAVTLQTSDAEYFLLADFDSESELALAKELWSMTQIPNRDPAHVANDATARVGARSLLSRVHTVDEDEHWPVDFCHRSMREFFAARGICRQLNEAPELVRETLKSEAINHEILDFAAALLRRRSDAGWKSALKGLIKTAESRESPLGGNCATLLYRAMSELEGTDWSGLNLDRADLGGADLSKKNFSKTSMRSASLDNTNLEDSDFRGADLTGVRFEQTTRVTAICAERLPSDRLLAAYADGFIREWEFSHPRKDGYTILAEGGTIADCLTMFSDSTLCAIFDGEAGMFRRDTTESVSEYCRLSLRPEIRTLIVNQGVAATVSEAAGEQQIAVFDLEHLTPIISIPSQGSAIIAADRTKQAVAVASNSGVNVHFADGQTIPIAAQQVTSIAISASNAGGLTVACGQRDGHVRIWRMHRNAPDGGDAHEAFEAQVHDGVVSAVSFLDDGRLASGGTDRRICVFNWNVGAPMLSLETMRELQLTLRCKGMNIQGVTGDIEREHLQKMIDSA